MNRRNENMSRGGVSGSFYPLSKRELERMLHSLYKPYGNKCIHDNVSAVILPHAGYSFSGNVAASAIGMINSEKKYDRIFIIGNSHKIYIDGASIDYRNKEYDTPLGMVRIDTACCEKLLRCNSCFTYRPGAHIDEHCIEVQLPLLKYHLKEMPPVVPIVVGTDSIHLLLEIADALQPYFGGNNLFVISSDFSHYPSYDDAIKVDALTALAIMNCSPDEFVDTIMNSSKMNIPNLITSACGQSAIGILLYMASKYNDVKVIHTKYANSGDSEYGNHDRVVGYHAFVFMLEDNQDEMKTFRLSSQEKQILLDMARNSIGRRLLMARAKPVEEWSLSDNLKRRFGVFVTLLKDKKLRGCIGHFGSELPIYQNVMEMAQASAFEDPRFPPLKPEELDHISIEISILTPMRRIYNISEFVLGKHGIFMKKDGRCGTFLPQLANEIKWSKIEFLGHCAHDKAGIGWDGWKDAELYVYETIVFKESGDN